jgi:crotonobetainyl-CoA:carnitine CoA-transferase CaiB-like acyl-CoA transferase
MTWDSPAGPAPGRPDASGALAGTLVVDFSTLTPGPLATLMLAEAGADVVKIERPGGGDEMRARAPRLGADSAQFALLNRGKRSVVVDLKSPAAIERLRGLLERADVLVEQFRPGVMARLGLGYDAVRAINPRVVYCSITGYGQSGPRANLAGHDLNYVAESGLLSLGIGADGAPTIPAALVGDIAGGTYPAVINIALALLRRERTGEGAWLDIAMADNLAPFMAGPLARGLRGGAWPEARMGELTGASPRYRTYATRDGRRLAVGALEDRYWTAFCDGVGVDALARATLSREALADAVAARVATRSAREWTETFEGIDACVSVVRTLPEVAGALTGGPFGEVSSGGERLPALSVPIAAPLRRAGGERAAPALGESGRWDG